MPHIFAVKLARFTKYRLQTLEKRLEDFIPPPPSTAEEILEQQLRDLDEMPRKASGRIEIMGWDIEYHDGPALSAMIRNQVLRGANDFQTANSKPYIIDCGANIGISVLRYKQICPQARILAFEPDPQAYALLERNIRSNDLTNVETIQAAVWFEHKVMPFFVQGIDGGHLEGIKSRLSGLPWTDVRAIALTDYLIEKIDLLKIDIEGAELDVLSHCAEKLGLVQNLIVEVHYHVDRPTYLGSILEILDRAKFNVAMVTPVPVEHAISLKNPYKAREMRNADIYPILYAWRENLM